MAKKNQFYTVWKGLKPGVYNSWDKCKEQVNGFEGAQYKGYPTLQEAENALKQNYWQAIQASKKPISLTDSNIANKPISQSLAVDAACSGNPGSMEYRGVDTATGKELFRVGPFENGTNNIGEFLALVHGLALLKQQNSDIPIYSDSKTAIAWVRQKKCKSKLAQNTTNTKIFELITRAEKWLNSNTYNTKIFKWETELWGEIPADFGRK